METTFAPVWLGGTLLPSVPTKRRKSEKEHKCKICDKRFSRQEHCVRHERGRKQDDSYRGFPRASLTEAKDTQERPFPCRYCERHYARRDLVTRHEKSLRVDVYRTRSQPPSQKRSTISSSVNVEPQAFSAIEIDNVPPNIDAGNAEPQDLSNLVSLRPSGSMGHDPSNESTETTSEYSEEQPPTTHPLAPHNSISLANGNNTGLVQTSSSFPDFGAQIMYETDPSQLSFPQLFDMQFDTFDFFSDMPISEGGGLYSPTVSNNLLIFNGGKMREHEPSQANDPGFSPTAQSLPVNGTPASDQTKIVHGYPFRPPSFCMTEPVRDLLLQDLGHKLSSDHRQKLRLPSRNILNRFVGTYLLCFHQHYPIIHVPSVALEQLPAALVLAICSIGALYCLDRKNAAYLQQLADHYLDDVISVSKSRLSIPLLTRKRLLKPDRRSMVYRHCLFGSSRANSYLLSLEHLAEFRKLSRQRSVLWISFQW
jgi:hypothetical protein